MYEGRNDQIQVMELFGPTIQGEGLMTGTVTHFLRTGGCGLRCNWCDSLFAVLPDEIKKHRVMMTTGEILTSLTALPWAPYVTFTGGDPAIQDRLGDLVLALNGVNMQVAVETQGQYFPDWLKSCDVLTFSPKGPSSGNIVDVKDLAAYCMSLGKKRRQKICIKVVIFDEEDFDYAMHVYDHIPPAYYDAFYFTAGTPPITTPPELAEVDRVSALLIARGRIDVVLNNQQQIADMLLSRAQLQQFNYKVHVGCQQHVLLWPTEDKGV